MATEVTNTGASLRSQLKATPIKSLQRQVDDDNLLLGSGSTDYLALEDGKTVKIRIFPAHPGGENFYIARKSYWLSFQNADGEMRRGTVLDSKTHGGTKWDVVEEYVRAARAKVGNDVDKLRALTGTDGQSNSLNPSYTWLCYADKVKADEPLKARLWEFRKSVRDALNRLAFNEDEDEVIEVDPFTDPDDGLPVMVTYRKNPDRKKGEQYYDVVFPKKVAPRPLTDDEIEYFMKLPPLADMVSTYGLRDFERALEGLQNFDDENDIRLFEDDAWLDHVEEIRAQYAEEPSTVDDDDEEEEEKPAPKKVSVPATLPHSGNKPTATGGTVFNPDDEEEEEEDEFDDMDRTALKQYIVKQGLTVSVKKSMTDDDLRTAIRTALKAVPQGGGGGDDDEEEEEETPTPASAPSAGPRVTLDDIRKKLAGKA